MKKFLIRWLRRLRYGAIDTRCNCVACGAIRRHKIEWVAAQRAIIHTCKRCGAQWAQLPVINANVWNPIKGTDEQ